MANSLESRMVVPSLASSPALKFSGILLCPDTRMIQNLCTFSSSFIRVRHLCTVLDALMAAGLSESIVMSALGTYMIRLISAAARTAK